MTRSEVIELLRKKQSKRSLREFGASIGVSAAYLSDILCGNRYPGPSVLKALGIEKVTTTEYVRKGKL